MSPGFKKEMFIARIISKLSTNANGAISSAGSGAGAATNGPSKSIADMGWKKYLMSTVNLKKTTNS